MVPSQTTICSHTSPLFLLQVSAVLAYSHENIVDPFLEPVLGLAQALLEKDQQDMHRNMDGIGHPFPAPPRAVKPPTPPCLLSKPECTQLAKARRL